MRIVTKVLAAFSLVFISALVAKPQHNDSRKLWVDVTVTDKSGVYVDNLKAENFELSVDKKTQKITDFIRNNEAVSVIFLIDFSGSIKDTKKIKKYIDGIENFIQNANQNNEYSIVVFDAKPQIVLDVTQNIKAIKESLLKISEFIPKGNTAFYDSLYITAQKLVSDGKNRKKVLIVCSDGIDNVSQTHNFRDVKNFLNANSILLYSVDPASKNLESIAGMIILDELAFVSGGKPFYPSKSLDAFNLIAKEISSQYLIAFEITNITNISEQKKIGDLKVKVNSEDKIKLTARARRELYLPKAK